VARERHATVGLEIAIFIEMATSICAAFLDEHEYQVVIDGARAVADTVKRSHIPSAACPGMSQTTA